MSWLIDPITGAMQWALTVFYNFTVSLGYANYGVAIILLTIAIKMLLYPLTVKQTKSLAAMAQISPKIKTLQEKYKDDKEKLQKEMSKLFSEAGINPAAGCLPIIIQMPFLFAIFWAVKDYNYVSNPSFLWISDLSQTGDPYFIMPVIAVIVTYISSKQNSAGTAGNPQAKMMTAFMPLVMGWITHTTPAGLGLYLVFSTVVQVVQQWWINRGLTPQGGAK